MNRMCVFTLFMMITVGAGAGEVRAAPGCGPGVTTDGVVRININTADAEALSSGLKGVGKAKAQAIVNWRQQNGRFRNLQQLDEVKGIGPGILERNRDRIVFGD